jgi:hypothetical protein
MDETSPAILLTRLKELRGLLHSPGGEQQGPRVDALAIFIARRAPNPSIRELAMRVMAEGIRRYFKLSMRCSTRARKIAAWSAWKLRE